MRRGFVALAVLIAACGGGSTGTGAQATSAAAGGTPPTATVAASGGSGGGTAARPFRELAGAAIATPYKVSYRVTSTAGGQAVSAQQTWYVSGQRFRMDLAVAGTVTSTISVFAIPEGTFTCINAGGSTQCLRTLQTQAYAQSPGAVFDAQIRANPDAFGATFKETRTISGASTSCYGLAGTSAGFSQGTICYTSAGVPLLYQFDTAGLSFTMEATSFGVPTDADFKLPAAAT